MSLLLQEMRRTYAAQRGVSQGASITLAVAFGALEARFECATRCAAILGERNLYGDTYLIPIEESHRALGKLSESLSVAIVDTVTDECGTRFVLVWKIVPRAVEMQVAVSAEVNLDEY